MPNNVLNYHQFVLAIQNDGEWYHSVQRHKNDGDFVRFTQTTRLFIVKTAREQEITAREARDRGYIYAALWDEGEFPIPVTELASRFETRFSTVLLKGVDDYITARKSIKASPAAPTQPEIIQPKEQDMHAIPEIKSVTFMNGVDVTTLTENQLITAIANCEQQIDDLKKIKAKSAAIASKIASFQGVIAQLVNLLDGGTAAPDAAKPAKK